MDTKRVRRALLDRGVLLLFVVLFVPLSAEIYLFPLVPSSVGSVVQPVLLLLSIPGKYVATLGSTLFTAVPHLRIPGDGVVVITALFYLFAVVAAGIGRVLGRYASEPTHATRLRYLGAGALVLAGVLAVGFTVQIPATCDPSGDCTFAGWAYRLFVLAVGGGLCAAGFGVVGVDVALRRIRSRSV